MYSVKMKTAIFALAATLAITTAGVGTYAKFAFTKTSTNNQITASKFDVVLNGTCFQAAGFNITNLNPIDHTRYFIFSVDKNHTDAN